MGFETIMKTYLKKIASKRHEFIQHDPSLEGKTDKEIFDTYWCYSQQTEGHQRNFVKDSLEKTDKWHKLPKNLKNILD